MQESRSTPSSGHSPTTLESAVTWRLLSFSFSLYTRLDCIVCWIKPACALVLEPKPLCTVCMSIFVVLTSLHLYYSSTSLLWSLLHAVLHNYISATFSVYNFCVSFSKLSTTSDLKVFIFFIFWLAGSYVALTLLGKPPAHLHGTIIVLL